MGFGVTSHNNARIGNAVFDNISMPHGSLGIPSPWQSQDIGEVGFDGGWASFIRSHLMITLADEGWVWVWCLFVTLKRLLLKSNLLRCEAEGCVFGECSFLTYSEYNGGCGKSGKSSI